MAGPDAPAASIYDDDDMLCSIVGQPDTEIIEVAIRKIETTACCFEHAVEGSQTASLFIDAVMSTELIEWNGALCYPAMIAFTSISAGAVIQYARAQSVLAGFRKDFSLHIDSSCDLEDGAMEALTWAL